MKRRTGYGLEFRLARWTLYHWIQFEMMFPHREASASASIGMEQKDSEGIGWLKPFTDFADTPQHERK